MKWKYIHKNINNNIENQNINNYNKTNIDLYPIWQRVAASVFDQTGRQRFETRFVPRSNPFSLQFTNCFNIEQLKQYWFVLFLKNNIITIYCSRTIMKRSSRHLHCWQRFSSQTTRENSSNHNNNQQKGNQIKYKNYVL
jgi:hypothetical protein